MWSFEWRTKGKMKANKLTRRKLIQLGLLGGGAAALAACAAPAVVAAYELAALASQRGNPCYTWRRRAERRLQPPTGR